MLRKILCHALLSLCVFFFAGACFGMGNGEFTHPGLYVVHKTPFSEEFGKVLESLEDRYIFDAYDLDYSKYFVVMSTISKDYEWDRTGFDTTGYSWERFSLGFASSYWEDCRAYLFDSGVTLIFEGKYWNRIGIHVGELTEEEIVDFFKRRGCPLEEIPHWKD
jgi:hypothetical protein